MVGGCCMVTVMDGMVTAVDENPRNVGSLDPSRKDVGTGLVGAPACGDVMKVRDGGLVPGLVMVVVVEMMVVMVVVVVVEMMVMVVVVVVEMMVMMVVVVVVEMMVMVVALLLLLLLSANETTT
eukprot:TRINITY_DN67788_c1_g2_i4.p1 TRINITY_DN67788_c1_g2~~TRINITY_DN67788_c1_g2_i4.p1  ORF type:complete len:124 (-),score=44.27 TRINITY_DN67788_c1_g2_i4:419-790(-)